MIWSLVPFLLLNCVIAICSKKLDNLFASKFSHSTPSILLYTGHSGTISELQGVLKNLFGEFRSHKPPSILAPSISLPMKMIETQICDKYSLIIISDALSLAAPLLEHIAWNNGCQKSKIILNVTNRFDYQAEDHDQFLLTINLLTKNPSIFWAPNNLYELEHFKLSGISLPKERVLLCPPIGFETEIPFDQWPQSMKSLTHKVPMATSNRSRLWNVGPARHLNQDSHFKQNVFVFEESFYGGVESLLRNFDWFFYLPYQFSTMKVFECLRAGVVLVVPSEAMFKEMIEQLMKDKSDEFALQSMHNLIWNNYPHDWQRFFDVYSKKNAPLIIKVKSWRELNQWIRKRQILNVDLEKHKNLVSHKMKRRERKILNQWKKLLIALF